jgi:hypothetical protein
MSDDTKIDDAYIEKMQALAQILDDLFNGDVRPKKACFVLLLTEFGDMAGRVNYISNGERSDIVTMLKEVTTRFEGQPEVKGTA